MNRDELSAIFLGTVYVLIGAAVIVSTFYSCGWRGVVALGIWSVYVDHAIARAARSM